MATKRPLPNLLRETTKIGRQTDRLTWSRYWRGCLGRGAVNMGHRNRVETNYTNQQQVDFNLSLVPLEHVIPHQKPYQYAIPKWAPKKEGNEERLLVGHITTQLDDPAIPPTTIHFLFDPPTDPATPASHIHRHRNHVVKQAESPVLRQEEDGHRRRPVRQGPGPHQGQRPPAQPRRARHS